MGLLERELNIYQKLNEIYGVEFIFLTYEEEVSAIINKYNDFTYSDL